MIDEETANSMREFIESTQELLAPYGIKITLPFMTELQDLLYDDENQLVDDPVAVLLEVAKKHFPDKYDQLRRDMEEEEARDARTLN